MFVAIPKNTLQEISLHLASLNEEKQRSLSWVVMDHVKAIKDSEEIKSVRVEDFAKKVESKFLFASNGAVLQGKTFYVVVKPDGSAEGSRLASSECLAWVDRACADGSSTTATAIQTKVMALKEAGYALKRLTLKLKLELELC